MPHVKCCVGGCTKKLQPVLKVEPRDRDTWLYRECDVCLRPVCEEHSTHEEDGKIVCDRCLKEREAESGIKLIDLGVRPLPEEE